MAKTPPKETINKNILMFIQRNQEATLEEISEYLDLQAPITEQLINNLLKRDFISKNGIKYYLNYLYDETTA